MIISTFQVNVGDVLQFQMATDPLGDLNTMNIQGFVSSAVPEPATMALNGLVLAGAAAGWAWKRRRTAA
jgi:hypothetical protein